MTQVRYDWKYQPKIHFSLCIYIAAYIHTFPRVNTHRSEASLLGGGDIGGGAMTGSWRWQVRVGPKSVSGGPASGMARPGFFIKAPSHGAVCYC